MWVFRLQDSHTNFSNIWTPVLQLKLGLIYLVKLYETDISISAKWSNIGHFFFLCFNLMQMSLGGFGDSLEK